MKRSNRPCIVTWQFCLTWLSDVGGIREKLRVQGGRRQAGPDGGRAAPKLHCEVVRRHPRRALVDGVVVLEGQRARCEMLATLQISSMVFSAVSVGACQPP